MQQQLWDVRQVSASSYAYAAVRGDGTVVTWGDPTSGGDSSSVEAAGKGACHDALRTSILMQSWRGVSIQKISEVIQARSQKQALKNMADQSE